MKLTSVLILILFNQTEYAFSKTIKIAVLDSLQSQKLASEKYQSDYFSGINAAVFYGEKRFGLNIIYKYFEYGKGDLDILKKINEVKSWEPDAIIGPRSSGKFLLLNNHFKDTVVISTLASSSEIRLMNKNFFSLSTSNQETASALMKFVSKEFNKRKISIFTETECKSCSDFSNIFKKIYKKMVFEKSLLKESIENIRPSELANGIGNSDLILLSATDYVSSVLLNKLTAFDPKVKRIFLGTDEWGSFKSSYVGKIHSTGDFAAYRVDPMLIDEKSEDLKLFKNLIKEMGNVETDEISTVSFLAAKIIIDSYQVNKASNETNSHKILNGFLKKRSKYYSIIKKSKYIVYKRDGKNETIYSIIN
jgi:hypothetical protein